MNALRRPRTILVAALPGAALLLSATCAWCVLFWTPDERLTDIDSPSTDPAVAVDMEGVVHVVWVGERGGPTNIYYRKREDGTWTNEESLTADEGHAWIPAIETDLGGNVHVAWSQRRGTYMSSQIYYKFWNGFGWSTDEQLTATDGSSGRAKLVAPLSGILHVLYCDEYGDGEAIHAVRFHAGTNWLPPVAISEEAISARDPDAEEDPEGNIHAVWAEYHDTPVGLHQIYYAKWNGVTWCAPELLTEQEATAGAPVIAVEPSGKLHVVWVDVRDGNDEIYYKHWDGEAWSQDERFTNDTYSSTHPSIAADSLGNVHVVWADNRAGNYEIYYSRFNGNVWTEDTRVTYASGTSDYPDIATDSQGNVHLVWCDQRDGHEEIYYKSAYLVGADSLNSSIDPWDIANRVFVSPGTQSGVDQTTITLRDSDNELMPYTYVRVDFGDCYPLCIGGDPPVVEGVTDANGELVLDPEVGGCAECEVRVVADGVVLRTYPRVVSTDWDGEWGDGQVDGSDSEYFQEMLGLGAGDCADYDGDGSVSVEDYIIFTQSYVAGDVNSDVLCIRPTTAAPAARAKMEGWLDIGVSGNPIRSGSTQEVTFWVPAPGQGVLKLHSVAGRLVSTIATGNFATGRRREVWAVRDSAGHPLAAGTYFLHLRTAAGEVTRKITVIR